MSENRPPYSAGENVPYSDTNTLRVVKSVTLTVNSDWASLLTALQTEKNRGGRFVLVNVRDFRLAAVAEFERPPFVEDVKR